LKKVNIFYFSGTGNTKYVVDALEIELSANCTVEKHNIESPGAEVKAVEAIKKSDLNVFAFPVYAFDSPIIINRFLKTVKKIKNGNSFKNCKAAVIACPGDTSGMNHTAAKMFSNKLKKAGFEVVREDQIAMPPNIFVKITVEEGRDRLIKANEKIIEIAKKYNTGETNSLEVGVMMYPLYYISKLEHVGAKFFGKAYKVDKDKCIDCGLCIKKCPQKNITVKNGNIKFGWDCIFCMRCLYSCPARAITNKMGFVYFKEGYDLKKYK